MVIVPNSTIRLLKCPIEMDNENQLTFASVTAQTNYFLSLPYLEETNCSYQRKDGVIRFETDPDGITFEDLLKYNYVMYQNTSYSNKWFYAFIKNIRYVNDGMSELTIETDVFQSWQFAIQYKRTFVEREHVNNDSVGLHTIPENLELGDYVCTAKNTISLFSNFTIALAVTRYPGTTATPGSNVGGKMINGVYSGYDYIIGENVNGINNILKSYADSGYSNAVQNIILIPSFLINNITWITVAGWSYNVKYGTFELSNSSYGGTIIGWNKPTKLAGNYTPKNNKLRTWPYMFLNVDNNAGNCVTYRYEDFSADTLSFDFEGCATPGGSFKIAPSGYKGVLGNYLYGFTPAKIPVCNWSTDLYTNWLTQNGVNMALNTAANVVQIASGNVASGVLGIGDTLAQVYQHSLIPPSLEGNINSGDVTFASGMYNPIGYAMSIKKEYAEIIDNFFSAYGYKVNNFKTPNVTGRTNWNYVKTINCNIEGEIPQEDIQKIKSIFNNGVTFWHNPSTFLDYSQNNTIVS